MGNYLKKNLVPNVRRLLSEISTAKERDFSEILSWELPGKGPSRLRGNLLRKLFFLPIAGANLAIPMLTALFSVGAFLFPVAQSGLSISPLETGLIVFNAAAWAYTAYWGFEAELKR